MTDSSLSFPDQPRVELDRRLGDLVAAANEVLATQGRLRALLRATQAVTSQLELPAVLRSIVEAARELAGAQYAALGVIDQHGELEQFVHTGMDEETVRRIGHLPRGRGLLGAVITEAQPIRTEDLTAHPRSVGFPDGHPPMKDFLGVPVRARGAVFGNLYLTNSESGAFTEEDEQLVRSLAATAGIAIENARLYTETKHRQAWAAASVEVTARLLSVEGGALAFVAERVQAVAEAASVYVVLLAEDPGVLRVVDVRGADPLAHSGAEIARAGTFSDMVLEKQRPVRLDENEFGALGLPGTEVFGPVMGLPLTTADRTLGALVVLRRSGEAAFSDADLEMGADFAGRASVALELHGARSDQERMALFEERGRIARDLHDRVIQQLFATGMQLQGVLGTLPAGRNAERVDAAVLSLDAAIAQIRRIIFTLSEDRRRASSSARHQLLDLVADLGSRLGLEPAITFTGPVDTVLDAELGEDVLAVVSEAVSNAVKHAGAHEITVAVAAEPDGVSVTVTNDGAPVARSDRRSGLANLEERASQRNGRLSLRAEGARTVLRWSVPLVRPAESATG